MQRYHVLEEWSLSKVKGEKSGSEGLKMEKRQDKRMSAKELERERRVEARLVSTDFVHSVCVCVFLCHRS